jgi:CBS domain-containing protein
LRWYSFCRRYDLLDRARQRRRRRQRILGGNLWRLGDALRRRRASRRSFTVSFLSLSTDPVSQAYPDEPLVVTSAATVGDVMQLMRAQKGSCVLICDDDGKLAGIFTERDALRWMAEPGSPSANIREMMTPNPARLESKTSVGTAIETMAEGGYRHLPIVDEAGVPTGVAAVRGIVHYLVDHFPETIYTLPPEPGKKPSERDGG